MRYRVAIRFAIDGDLRFISHHDTMRLFERALARTRLPVKYSRGFNPRPRLSLPLPRAVGVASTCDVLVLELCEATEPGDVLAPLAGQMPPGVRLLDARRVEAGAAVQPETVTYALPLTGEQVSSAQAAVERLLAAEQWRVDRGSADGRSGKTVDLRGYLVSAGVQAKTLRWTVRVTSAGTVRPAEMLDACGLDAKACQHRVTRVDVCWSDAGSADRERMGPASQADAR